MAFEDNRGRTSGGADFVATGQEYRAQIRASSIVLKPVRGPANTTAKNSVTPGIRILLSGANQEARGQAEDKLPGYSNYLFGSDPAKWIAYVDHYAKVRYPGVYPGIDLLLHGNDNHLEQDFVIHAGANPKEIDLQFPGVKEVRRTADGDLALRTGGSGFQLKKPKAYQVVDGKELPVTVRYLVRRGAASFGLGHYDAHKDLIIDPVLVFSTFFGGPLPDPGTSITQVAADASGVYLTGTTSSANFPVTLGAFETQPQVNNPVSFVSKLDPTGQTLIFSTYLQAGLETPSGFAVDGSQNIYIGMTSNNSSSGTLTLPIPAGSQPFQSVPKSNRNVGIVKLNSGGSAVLAATYLGGSVDEEMGGLALDPQGNLYVSGNTGSNDFPVKNPLQNALGTGGQSGFATEFNPNLSELVYSTYFGGNSNVQAFEVSPGVAVDSLGNAYIIGEATAGFPTTTGAYQPTCSVGGSGYCSFLVALKAGGSAFGYSTFLSGTLVNATGIGTVSVDGAGNAYVAGTTADPTFPVLNPILACGPNTDTFDPFVSEFNSAGGLVFSTCLGEMPNGGSISPVTALTLDSSGNAYLASASVSGFPLQNPIDSNPPAAGSANGMRQFISEISSSSHTLIFSSYVSDPGINFNGSLNIINSVAVDPGGNVYLAGNSKVNDEGYSFVPVFNALQPANGGGFVIKISPSAGAAAAVAPGALVFGPTVVGSTTASQTATIYDLGTDSLTVPNVAVSGDFAQSNDCVSVNPSGGSCTVQVTFTPAVLGTRNGTLTITDSSAGSPHQVALIGTGATGNFTPSVTSLTFSGQAIGTTSGTQTVTFTAGALAVQSFSIQTSGDFAETNNCGTSVAALATCAINVSFTPTATGTRTGTVTVTDSAPNSPQLISLTGTGVASTIGLGVAPGTPTAASVAAGSNASYSLVIGGEGMSGTASLVCTGAPAGATCSVPTTISVSATSAATFSVSVTTTRTAGVVRFWWPRSLPLTLLALVVALVVFLGRQTTRPWVRRWALGLFLVASLGALYSCGGNAATSSGGTPAGSYQIVVSAQLDSASQSTSVTLNVQ